VKFFENCWSQTIYTLDCLSSYQTYSFWRKWGVCSIAWLCMLYDW